MKKRMLKIIAMGICAAVLTSCAGAINENNYDEIRSSYMPTIPYSEDLSEEEKKVDEWLSELKAKAQKIDYGDGSFGAIDWDDEGYMNSELYDFCLALPKGGDLHAHDETMIPVKDFVETVKASAKISLAGDTYGYLYATNNPDAPEDAVLLQDALAQGLITEDELYDTLTLSEEDKDGGIWVNFERLFSVKLGLNTDDELMGRIYEQGFRSCCEKGILLLEIRSILVTDDDENNLHFEEIIRDAYYRVKEDYPDFTVRIIGNTGKNDFFSKELGCNVLNSFIRISKKLKDESDPENPRDFIIGLDLVNEEDSSKPLSEYADYFLSDEVQDCGMQLFLHCGESLRSDNSSVIDAYLLGSARVGHALNLYRFPKLMEKYSVDGIAVEVCPMSNYRLGYVDDLRLHPALTYLRNDIPVVICSDDGLFMSESPLVDDFFAAIMCWDLSLGDIKALCRNSITYSGLPDDEKDSLMRAWEAQWAEFIKIYSQASSLPLPSAV